MDLFEQSVNSIQTFVETGYIDQALKMLDALETAFPDKRADLLWIKARIMFETKNKKEALFILIELLEIYKDQDALYEIKENYINPTKEKYLEQYKYNRDLLLGYEDFFGNINEIPEWYVIWDDSDLVVVLNESEGLVHASKRIKIKSGIVNKEPVFVEGGVFAEQLEIVGEMSHFTNGLNGLEYGIIVAFNSWELETFMQVSHIDELLETGRFIFAIDKDGLERCYEDMTAPIPRQAVNLAGKPMSLYPIYDSIIKKNLKESNELLDDLINRYNDNDCELKKRVKQKTPKILFWTSRFTTVLQYHTKNAMEAAKKLGCECRFLIEPSDIRRLSDCHVLNVFDEFEPDVVFMLDHFRFEHAGFAPPNVMWVTWIQDPMQHIMDPASFGKLSARDILLSHFVSYDDFKKLYPGRLVDAAIPANDEVYKPYVLTEEEKEKYSCDICFVCHASDVDEYVNSICRSYAENEKEASIIRGIINKYQEDAYGGYFLYSEEDFYNYLKKKLSENGYDSYGEGVRALARDMFLWLNQRVFRQCLVDWMLEAGFTNIKLWGNGWKNIPKYEKYAMGAAENGETLSRIYQASKIVIGNNIVTTAAARAWESMLSGTMYLSNVIPEGADWCDIHKIMPEGTVEYFHNKEELIEKLHYYLEHDDERKRMAEIGRQEALKRMTFEALMKKVLDILPDYLDD